MKLICECMQCMPVSSCMCTPACTLTVHVRNANAVKHFHVWHLQARMQAQSSCSNITMLTRPLHWTGSLARQLVGLKSTSRCAQHFGPAMPCQTALRNLNYVLLRALG